MFDRKTWPQWGVALFILACLAQVWVFRDGPIWPKWVWIPLYAIGLASVWGLRDRSAPKSKVFDFNPRRGALYGLAGLAIFPVMAIVNAAFGAELSFSSMVVSTLVGSIFIGIVSTFTERSAI
jgi:hypothetical protein